LNGDWFVVFVVIYCVVLELGFWRVKNETEFIVIALKVGERGIETVRARYLPVESIPPDPTTPGMPKASAQ